MVRICEDASERLDIVLGEFFVHRHVRGKWACKCCQTLSQTPVDPQLIDKGMPAPGLVAHAPHPARDIDALLPHRWTPSQRG